MDTVRYTIDCTGDAVAGDEIVFTEAVFAGSFRRPRFVGERTIIARIDRDSYGEARQQHTFTMTVLASEGIDAPEAGATIKRKGRNVYRNGTRRARWADESSRREAASDKHRRGDAARAERAARVSYC